MSILDAQRYVESMTRKEIADALKKGGHPLVPAFVLADRAEQLKNNDAAVKKMEEMAGIPAPNQDIGSKLAQYLEANMRAEEEKSRGGLGMPGQGVGEPMPKPGMPPVPSGAGKPMPGATAFGQGTPMAKAGGGLIPRYQDRGLVEGSGLRPPIARRLDPDFEYDPEMPMFSDRFPGFSLGDTSDPYSLPHYLGRGFGDFYGGSQQLTHGLANLIEMLPGQQFGEDGMFGGRRAEDDYLLSRHLFKDRNDPDSYYDPRVKGWSGLERRLGLTTADRFNRRNEQERQQVQSLYDMLSGRLGDMRTAATTETGAEADLREAREGFAQRIRSRKQDIRDILPTEEQDKLRTSATMLELISDTMGARSTDPANSGFGRIARGMRELGQQRQERDLGIEELMFGLDKGAFDVEDRNRAGLATLSRAGERYDESEFDLMLAQYEARQKALLEAQKAGQGLYKPAQWASVINFLEGPESVEIPEADRTRIQQILVQSMTGGAAGMPAGTSELIERMVAGDLSEEERTGLLARLARGAALGAPTGAVTGSMIFPGIGTTVGAAGGATLGALTEAIFGN